MVVEKGGGGYTPLILRVFSKGIISSAWERLKLFLENTTIKEIGGHNQYLPLHHRNIPTALMQFIALVQNETCYSKGIDWVMPTCRWKSEYLLLLLNCLQLACCLYHWKADWCVVSYQQDWPRFITPKNSDRCNTDWALLIKSLDPGPASATDITVLKFDLCY